MYPATEKDPKGKLRLSYEVMPFAKIFELCGGASWDGEKSILKNKINLNNVHQKIPTFLEQKKKFINSYNLLGLLLFRLFFTKFDINLEKPPPLFINIF